MQEGFQVITANPQETELVGEKMGKWLKKAICICLYGELGAGKTTFVRGLARGLLARQEKIKSPTFVYLTPYALEKGTLWHLDCYRLPEHITPENIPKDLLEPLREGKDYVAVEWAERIQEYLPKKRVNVKIDYADDEAEHTKGKRRIIIEMHDRNASGKNS